MAKSLVAMLVHQKLAPAFSAIPELRVGKQIDRTVS
jgi:hypothetical protein